MSVGTMPIARERRFRRLINAFTAVTIVLIVTAVTLLPVQAHRKGIYASEDEAFRQADKIGCTEIHENNGRWMPCADERELHQQMRRQ